MGNHQSILCAVDLGASNGRVMLGKFDGDQIDLEEIHRFPNRAVQVENRQYWDILNIFNAIKDGLCKIGEKNKIASMGVDTWGVDFGFIDKDGYLMGNPIAYRSQCWDGEMENALNVVTREEVYQRTGVQFLTPNTLFQLYSLRNSKMMNNAHRFLMMPDLLNYWLTGRIANSYTDATTTQFLNPHNRQYDLDLLKKLNIRTDIFPEIILPGTVLDNVSSQFAKSIHKTPFPVVVPACHDTAAAVAATPLKSKLSAYISSGTWSLVGVEVENAIITEKSFMQNFTNEGGVNNTIRFLKNIFGLWLIQECKRKWAEGGNSYSWDEIIEGAENAKPLQCVINPDDDLFFNPADMPFEIQQFCRKNGHFVPETHGEIVRCIFESLAMKYRWVIERIQEIAGFEVDCIHIVGGGSQNKFLCQQTANATGKMVYAGPVEAAALGNMLMQAIALGLISSISEARAVIKKSFVIQEYEPKASEMWDDAYQKFISTL